MAPNTDNGIVTITEEERDAILAGSRTRNSKDDYKKCLDRLMDDPGNFFPNIQERFKGVKAASVKTQLRDLAKELDLPVHVNQDKEHGVYAMKIA